MNYKLKYKNSIGDWLYLITNNDNFIASQRSEHAATFNKEEAIKTTEKLKALGYVHQFFTECEITYEQYLQEINQNLGFIPTK